MEKGRFCCWKLEAETGEMIKVGQELDEKHTLSEESTAAIITHNTDTGESSAYNHTLNKKGIY